jgi:hypothetical protein
MTLHGRPTMVIAMTTAAIIQPAAIHRPPNTIQNRLRSKETGDITGVVLASFKTTMAFTLPLVSFASWKA